MRYRVAKELGKRVPNGVSIPEIPVSPGARVDGIVRIRGRHVAGDGVRQVHGDEPGLPLGERPVGGMAARALHLLELRVLVGAVRVGDVAQRHGVEALRADDL